MIVTLNRIATAHRLRAAFRQIAAAVTSYNDRKRISFGCSSVVFKCVRMHQRLNTIQTPFLFLGYASHSIVTYCIQALQCLN